MRPRLRRHSFGSNHEGRKLHKPNLGPAAPSFDPGSTKRRPTIERMVATGMASASCWCGRGTVEISLDDVRAGITAACGRERCAPPTKGDRDVQQ